MSEKIELEEQEEKIDILSYIDDLWNGCKRLFWLLIVLVLACAALGYVRERQSYSPRYEAYSSFVVTNSNAYYSESEYYNQTTTEQLTKTFPYILTSGMLEEIVKTDLGLNTMPVTIEAESVAESNLFTIVVSGTNPQTCYDVLQSVIENYPSLAEYVVGSTTLTEIDASGVPDRPVNEMSTRRTLAIGAGAGFLLFCMVLFVYCLTHKSIRSEDDLKKLSNMKSLGAIPKARFKRRNKETSMKVLIDNKIIPANFKEAIRTMRTRVEAASKEEGLKTILVTSAISGEGKTMVAENLAISLASKEKRVLLVEANLRKPTIAKDLMLSQESAGLSAYLNGEAELEQVTVAYQDLAVIPAGNKVQHPVALISSGKMETLIQTCREQYDYVIFDTPPCSSLTDAVNLAQQVDGVIFVVRQDYAKTNKVVGAFELMDDVTAKMIGFTLNGVQGGITGYGYGYGGGYGYGRYGYGRYGYGRYGYGGYGSKTSRGNGSSRAGQEGE